MHNFELYLKENGWVADNEKPISSMVNLRHVWTKDEKRIIFGLSDKDFPPMVISPRPIIHVKSKKMEFEAFGGLMLNLMQLKDEILLNLILTDERVQADIMDDDKVILNIPEVNYKEKH